MKTVLIADDNDGNREILRVVLENAGYRVVEAASGQEAIEVAKKESPDAVAGAAALGPPDAVGVPANDAAARRSVR